MWPFLGLTPYVRIRLTVSSFPSDPGLFGDFFFFLNSGSQVWAGSLIEQKDQGETNTTHFIFMSFLLGGSEVP